MLGENGTRKGERTKKVPKYMQYDDADYGIFPNAKTAEQKEKQASTTENAQIARLFQKFITAINQKCRLYEQQDHPERPPTNPQTTNEHDPSRAPNHTDNPPQKQRVGAQTTKQPRETPDQKAVKIEGRKTAVTSNSKPNVSSNLQADHEYHGMLNQHVRSAYPNISSVSADMLKGLDIPRQLLQGPGARTKGKEEKKGSHAGKNGKTKEELKPFKRQSYHVAIAYHIHLKRIKTVNPNPTEIDPTYPARKLRETQGQ